jgi:hypothetical protein
VSKVTHLQLLKRLETAPNNEQDIVERHHSVGRDIGHLLHKRTLVGLEPLISGLSRTGGKTLSDWAQGYRDALVDLLSAYTIELIDVVHEEELVEAVGSMLHWEEILSIIDSSPRCTLLMLKEKNVDFAQLTNLLNMGPVQVNSQHQFELTLLGERVLKKLKAKK